MYGANQMHQQQMSNHPMTAQESHHQQQQPRHKFVSEVDGNLIVEKDQTIVQLKETIEILELKIKKLEQLVKLKDAKIGNLTNKLQSAGIL